MHKNVYHKLSGLGLQFRIWCQAFEVSFMSRRERGMAAEVHFHVWGEPTEVVASGLFLHEERRFRHGVFFGQREQEVILKPCLHRHDARRIAPKNLFRECVHAVQIQFHGWKVHAGEVLSLHP